MNLGKSYVWCSLRLLISKMGSVPASQEDLSIRQDDVGESCMRPFYIPVLTCALKVPHLSELLLPRVGMSPVRRNGLNSNRGDLGRR